LAIYQDHFVFKPFFQSACNNSQGKLPAYTYYKHVFFYITQITNQNYPLQDQHFFLVYQELN